MAVGMATPISVVIPVGPRPHHVRWLDEAIDSVLSQFRPKDRIVLILNGREKPPGIPKTVRIEIHSVPCALGLPIAFNVGIALASTELCILMGSDDRLLPGCLDAAREAWKFHQDPLGYYYLGVEYSDGRIQNTPCHAAMVTKELWKHTGGFAPESAVGACDTMFVSSLLQAKENGLFKGDFYQVDTVPRYWWRFHPESDASGGRDIRWGPIINQVRDLLTDIYQPTE